MLSVGQAFPDFTLQDQDGKTVTNQDFKGHRTVIFFYPKDDTPGCTAEACEFQASNPKATNIIGVSPDGVKSHRKFADKFGLEYTLLADTNHELCEKAGVWIEKSMYGKKYMGVGRTSFVVDENGKVEQVYENVKPQGHAAEVLAGLA
jgi:peroxiredoxin Q/BCP